MKIVTLMAHLLIPFIVFGQPLQQRLATAIGNIQKDQQFKHAAISLYVVDSKTGAVIFDHNAQLGLAPASSQKVITSVSAFELLGKDFRYNTSICSNGTVAAKQLQGDLIISGSGDPTLGSWRWPSTSTQKVVGKIVEALQQKNVTGMKGSVLASLGNWETQATPRGWTWEDMGNYYGAGAWGLNWHENQYNLILQPGKSVGDMVKVVKTEPAIFGRTTLTNELTTGPVSSGDNAIIYLSEYGTNGFVRGTVPAGKENFTIKGALPVPYQLLLDDIETQAAAKGIKIEGKSGKMDRLSFANVAAAKTLNTILQIESPSLDSMNYWFLRESINLYGEAFVKSIALKQKGFAATDSGLAIIRFFWSNRGIDKSALNIKDGSGLSPANRTTTNALVTVLQYARDKSWYSSFYNALPLMNGIKMKSGYINGVRSYTGYIKSKSGETYTFAFIVNNFDGNPGTVREKMWQVLDILK
jgi:serine-type D-Ala-D-Ala carboxypeptidase/endopeptidase (penicillin-binding protein 4)